MLQQAFDSDDLPNRAEMRLRKTGRAMGYTLSHIHDDDGRMVGATLFFKDLTRVEQIEERERLRDRLAALGEMAAAIAHEVKNPLASIEVMAGVLKRQMTDREEALETLNDIIKEAKMANAIVVEVLEFVRPIQLQVERAALDEVIKDSITLAEGKMRRGAVSIDTIIEPDVPELLADPHQLRQLFSNLLANAFEALGGEGHVDIRAWLLPGEDEPVGAADPQPPQVVVEVRDTGPGIARRRHGADFQSVFHAPSRRAPGWGWPSCARSSTRTTATSMPCRHPAGARRFASRCRSCRPNEVWGDRAHGTHSGCRRSRFTAQGPRPRADQRRARRRRGAERHRRRSNGCRTASSTSC